MEFIFVGVLFALWCGYKHYQESKKPISAQTWLKRMRKLGLGVRKS